MAPVVRLWLAFAAIGAGLIHLAVAAGSSLPIGIVLAGLGIVELGWGVAILRIGRILTPRLTLVAALLPVLFWSAIATLGSGFGLRDAGHLTLFPMAVASLFDVFVSSTLAVMSRRLADGVVPTLESDAPSDSQGWKFVLGLMLAGVVFSGLTTQALAGTEAGSQAVPHGSHSIPGLELPEGGHSHH